MRVGQHEEDVPDGINALPSRRDFTPGVLQHHWLHRGARQEGAGLEVQEAAPIGCGALQRAALILRISADEERLRQFTKAQMAWAGRTYNK